MSSTTIFTTVITPSQKCLSVPHTLSVKKRKGSGRLFSESTHTIFYGKWQEQVKTVFELSKKLFSLEDWDFCVSVDSEAVEGSSAAIPLFLLIAELITGEKLPENMFSTGSMSSPHGFLSYGHNESLTAKIEALEHFVSYSSIKDPQFLIPFPFHYDTKSIECVQVASVFSALKVALPDTYQECNPKIESISHVTSVLSGAVLDFIPSVGDVFVIHSPDVDGLYEVIDIGGTPVVVEELPPDEPAHFHFICNNRVMLAHLFINRKGALEKVSQYKEMLRNTRWSVVFYT